MVSRGLAVLVTLSPRLMCWLSAAMAVSSSSSCGPSASLVLRGRRVRVARVCLSVWFFTRILNAVLGAKSIPLLAIARQELRDLSVFVTGVPDA